MFIPNSGSVWGMLECCGMGEERVFEMCVGGGRGLVLIEGIAFLRLQKVCGVSLRELLF